MQAKKQQLESDMKQQTSSKLGKEYIKAIYCHLAYLTYMQSTSCENVRLDEAQVRIKIAGRNIISSNTQMTTPLWQKARGTLDESERRE